MNVQFLGGVRTVTGSATLLEKGPVRWLVDCGMYQGSRSLEERNRDLLSYKAQDLAFVLLTHAHIDHSGLIPKLVREGFQGKVICTRATRDLCEVMLPDSGHVQEMEVEWRNRKGNRTGKKRADPLYTVEDAEASLRYFQPVGYDQPFSPAEGVKVQFRDAGHILGSASIEIWIEDGGLKKKIVFSGDLGTAGQPIVRDPARIEEADLLWLESTYGNRLHKSKEETVEELLRIILQAVRDQAKVIIPAFAVERTQDVIFILGQLIRKKLIPSIPVYIDSPLAISATEIFKRNSDCFDPETREVLSGGENPLAFPQLIYTRTTEESKALNQDSSAGIIISASGMCDSGRILHHLKHHLWQETSHVVIIGYQAEGSIGRRIIDGAKVVRILGESVAVKAQIHTLGGFSAHADQQGLLEWLSRVKTPGLEVLVNHGEEEVSLEFAEMIRQKLRFKATVPRWGEKRTFFSHEEPEIEQPELPEREQEEEATGHAASPSALWKHLDRDYRKLRHKIRKRLSSDRTSQDPSWVKQMVEIDERVKDLERKL